MSPPQAHSALGASSAHRWMECAGSVSLSDSMESVPGDGAASPYALEGTLAHNYAEQELSDKYGVIKDMTPNIPEDMVGHVKVYTDLIGKFIEVSDWYELEYRFSLADLNPPVDAYGTSDFSGYCADEHSLIIADLKYGQGVVVEVEGNPQLWYYALGALLEFQKRSPGVRVDKIRLVIVQPRAYHPDGAVRHETITVQDLFEWADVLLDAMHATQEDNPEFKAGAHCRFCRAAAICPTLIEYNQKLAQADFADFPVGEDAMDIAANPSKLTNPEVAHLLERLDSIEHWVASVRQYAQGELSAGRKIPGWKLVEKQARRQWTDEEGVTKHMLETVGFGMDDISTVKLKSPAQMEKMLPKGVVLANYYDKVSSGVKLARQSSKLPDAAPVGQEFLDG